jgi:type IV pilus assembly protein PilW
MVAMVIGLIITFAVVQIFTTSRTTYQTDEGLARVQENGRFAMEFLTREIRQVGDLGCQQATEIIKIGESNTTNPATMYDNASAQSTLMTGIQGYEFQNTGAGDTYLITAANPANVSAGWLPAKNTVVVPPVLPPPALQLKPDYTLTDAVTGGTGLMPDATPGSDALVVQRMTNIVPAAGVQEDQTYVYVPSGTMPASGPAAITNCQHVSFFNISENTAVPGADRLGHDAGNNCKLWRSNSTAGFSASYGGTGVTATPICQSEIQGYAQSTNNTSGAAVVGQVSTTVFYIALGASGSPALFQRAAEWDLAAEDYINSNAQPPQELVDGIESMQILYGVDTGDDGTADTYVTADAVPSWIQVVSVQISLLARSANVTGDAADLTDDTNTYVLAGPDAANGVTIDPLDDKRRRRVFTTTVQLRNRGY